MGTNEWKYAVTDAEHGEGVIYTGESPDDDTGKHIAIVTGGLGCSIEDGRCYESEENGRKIVRAVNAHDDLLAACKAADTAMRAIFGNGPIAGRGTLAPEYEALRQAAVTTRAAIARAEAPQ